MRAPFFNPLLIAIGFVFSTQASAEPLASASMLAKATLLGIQSAVRQGHQSGKIPISSLSCIESLDSAALVPVFEAAANENWSVAEIADIEKFLQTDIGRKYVKASNAQAARDNGDSQSERIPSFTNAEGVQIERFKKTPAGQQLMVRTEFASEKSRQEIRAKTLELLQTCGLGR